MRTARAVPTPFECKKSMISRTIFLFGPSVDNALHAHGADSGHLAQTIGLSLDRIEHCLAERPNELLGVSRANATDHPRAEVFLDALD